MAEIIIEWDSRVKTEDEIASELFSPEGSWSGSDATFQADFLFVRRKISMELAASMLLSYLGLPKDIPFIREFAALMVLAVLSPLSVEVYSGKSFSKINGLMKKKFGDCYLEKNDVAKIISSGGETADLIQKLISNGFLEAENNVFWVRRKVLKNLTIC